MANPDEPRDLTEQQDQLEPDTPDYFEMRAPCPNCGATEGYPKPAGGQDVIWCATCDKYCYNRPRHESGSDQRSVRSRPNIKPSQRARILVRDGSRCQLCGVSGPPANLHIGHLVSVEDARELGLAEIDAWSDENLAAMCEECNLGLGRDSVPARLIAALIARRDKPSAS